MVNWKEIHENFTPELQKDWEKQGFNEKTTKQWVDIGLKPNDIEFVSYLRSQHNNPQKFLSEIKGNEKGKIRWDIEEIDHFSTWFSPNCAIIVTKKNNRKYGASLLVYDKVEKRPWCIKFLSTSNSFLEGIRAKVGELKESLKNHNIPILALLRIGNKPVYFSKIIKKVEMPKNNDPNKYIKKYDVIGIKMDGIYADHAAVYLGDKKVAHISGEGNYGINPITGNKNWRAQIDTWESFLKFHERTEEFHLYRPVIPFKRPELIQEHIDITIEKGYGLGEYHLFSKNCEHFATLCVGSVPFSPQVNNFFKWLKGDKLHEKWIGAEINKNNNNFAKIKEQTQTLEQINEEYENNSRYEKAVKERVSEISSSISPEEIEKIVAEPIDIPHSSNIEENFREIILETSLEQKELIDSEELERKESSSCKNILIVGRTGNGKSTLANVLSDTKNFEEKSSSISVTKKAQSATFEVRKQKYQVVDTIGIGDTRLSEEDVLNRIVKTAHSIKNGLHQILFVMGGRFDESEIKAYKLLKDYILDVDVADYTTIVHNNFPNFRSEKECKKDQDSLIEQNSELAGIIISCGERIIHVDNPTINILPDDDEDDNEKKDREQKINSNEEIRKLSREKLLNHLEICHKIYRPNNLQRLNIVMASLLKEIASLEEKLQDESNEEVKTEIQQDIKKEKEEIRNKIKHYLKKKGVYEKLLLEFVEKEQAKVLVETNKF